jgi:hypothetical protein
MLGKKYNEQNKHQNGAIREIKLKSTLKNKNEFE